MNIIFKPDCKTEIITPTYDLPIIGEPISKTGASANNSNAYGVIVGIIGDGSSRRVRVMTEGYIDYDKVKDNYMEYTYEAINALTGITLCSGGKFPTGGGFMEVEITLSGSDFYSGTVTFNKTYNEIMDAIEKGYFVLSWAKNQQFTGEQLEYNFGYLKPMFPKYAADINGGTIFFISTASSVGTMYIQADGTTGVYLD